MDDWMNENIYIKIYECMKKNKELWINKSMNEFIN